MTFIRTSLALMCIVSQTETFNSGSSCHDSLVWWSQYGSLINNPVNNSVPITGCDVDWLGRCTA